MIFSNCGGYRRGEREERSFIPCISLSPYGCESVVGGYKALPLPFSSPASALISHTEVLQRHFVHTSKVSVGCEQRRMS